MYGGTYTGSAYAFNTHDTNANAPVIVLHEGVVFGDYDNLTQKDMANNRVVPAEGCKIIFQDNLYKVVKE